MIIYRIFTVLDASSAPLKYEGVGFVILVSVLMGLITSMSVSGSFKNLQPGVILPTYVIVVDIV